jgi:hypothetical protein
VQIDNFWQQKGETAARRPSAAASARLTAARRLISVGDGREKLGGAPASARTSTLPVLIYIAGMCNCAWS